MKPSMLQKLISFVIERHSIYMRRQLGSPAPWTNDPVLRNFRFCNVFRELDTVTIWIRKNIREPYWDHPELWFMLCLARQINWTPTLQAIMDEGLWPEDRRWQWQKVAGLMRRMQASGEKVYTGAYMLVGRPLPGEPKDKPNLTCKNVLGALWKDRRDLTHAFESGNTLKGAWEQLTPYYGWGPFMSYEAVTDLRHTRYLTKATDIMLWANAGPGAIRGLNRLHGRPLEARVKQRDLNAEMCQLLIIFRERLERLKLFRQHGHVFEMRDVEHVLCEFDKYMRVLLKQGTPRERFPKGAGK